MIKKLVVCSLLVFSILGMGLFKEEKASAAYITASPTEQSIKNVLADARWHVSWSGIPYYTVAFQPDYGLDWKIISDQVGYTSRTYTYRYDLGTRAIKHYQARFMVADAHAVAFKDVKVTHVRTN